MTGQFQIALGQISPVHNFPGTIFAHFVTLCTHICEFQRDIFFCFDISNLIMILYNNRQRGSLKMKLGGKQCLENATVL